MNIFVSYTTRDTYINKELLDKVSNIVSELGSPYVDLLHNNSLDKQAYVESMLKSSDVVLLLSSDSIDKSKWVNWELAQAKKIKIPIVEVCAKKFASANFVLNIFSEIKSHTEANKKIQQTPTAQLI